MTGGHGEREPSGAGSDEGQTERVDGRWGIFRKATRFHVRQHTCLRGFFIFDHEAFIGLGSNLGDRVAHLQKAIERLDASPPVTVTAVSPVYESPALTLEPSEPHPDFLNAVVLVSTSLEPRALLRLLLQIEYAEGRVRRARWEPRTLDLDMLLYDDLSTASAELTLPHPGLSDRPFVLKPLSDLAPSLILPAPLSTSVYSLLQRCPHLDELRRAELVLLAPSR